MISCASQFQKPQCMVLGAVASVDVMGKDITAAEACDVAFRTQTARRGLGTNIRATSNDSFPQASLHLLKGPSPFKITPEPHVHIISWKTLHTEAITEAFL